MASLKAAPFYRVGVNCYQRLLPSIGTALNSVERSLRAAWMENESGVSAKLSVIYSVAGVVHYDSGSFQSRVAAYIALNVKHARREYAQRSKIIT